MKQKTTSLNILRNDKGKEMSLLVNDNIENEDDHVFCVQPILQNSAFEISDNDKINQIASHFQSIMNVLGLDVSNSSLKGTPMRVAKMFVKEAFSGLNPANKPTITLFDNDCEYHQMIIEKNIAIHSYCEHHFVPIIGKAHIGYIPQKKIIGLSKLNRIVNYFCKQPQVQERLTNQISQELQHILGHSHIAVWIELKHLCVMSRGIKDHASTTISSFFGGDFKNTVHHDQFMQSIQLSTSNLDS